MQETKNALAVISKLIIRCQKAQVKFAKGTAQFSLLENRIKALQLAQSLLAGEKHTFSPKELANALPPLDSIIHKTTTARQKFSPKHPTYRQLSPIISAMQLAKQQLEQTMLEADNRLNDH